MMNDFRAAEAIRAEEIRKNRLVDSANAPGKAFATFNPDSEVLNDVPPIKDNVAEIFGRVILQGKPPKERLLSIRQNQDGTITKLFSRDYEVSQAGGLAHAFVYLESGLKGATFHSPKRLLVLKETNQFLAPYVTGVQVEQAIEIENSKQRHQFRLVSSHGRESGWKSNSEGFLADRLELIFSEADVFSRITCKSHPWEWAYIGVVSHPFFAVTDKEGYFHLPKGIPPGTYKVSVQHPKAGKASQTIDATSDGRHNVLFKLNVPANVESQLDNAIFEREWDPAEKDMGSSARGVFSRFLEPGFTEGAPIIGKDGAPAGVIRGQVRLRGTPPPEKPIVDAKNDVSCGKIIPKVPTTRLYVTGENQGLADTVVYLESETLAKATFPVPTTPLLLDQVNCEYVPYVAAIQAGQKMLVRNSDPLMHNVHPTPTVSGNKEANKVQMPKAKDLEFVFEKPEPFLRFKCDVHPWMLSYVSVFNHPYFAVTDSNGNYSITNVPPGKYQVRAMHRKAGGVFTTEFSFPSPGRGGKIVDFEMDVNSGQRSVPKSDPKLSDGK